MTVNKNIQFGFLIFPGFPMSCLTSMIEPLRAANEISGHELFTWKLVSEDGERVQASAHVWFEPDQALAECDKLDRLFILSGPMAKFEAPQSSNGVLRKLSRHGVALGAISGGVFPLARAGLLDGHVTSVHWCYEAAFAAEFPDIEATENVIVLADNRQTASGAAAAFDLALHLIEEAMSADVATEVACWFQHPLLRGQGVTQRKPTFVAEISNDMLPPMVRKAVDIFAANIEDTLPISEVAKEAGVSVRQLERLFVQTTGKTPLGYYKSLRMHKARQLLHYSKDTMIQIALAVGYSSTASMSRTYVEVFGIPPKDDRKKINMFRVNENAILPQA
ncbi:GlxA family transcriptional regulator [Octadecabacter ascidiaceicola]|uniref:HTH-type transcriptional regulator CdhR n=1 Tax=Octadecabacter ascidiaceicola TaxID=1655543 RepID=A0A238KI76_9RHOB|nr:GlxA family transcriptional regulator [Octadecabacter ascidiaceicola]SMX42545.1 HTH-type transcriptional regulator CdhR [Octadecabacter ascidiaceicola]